MELVSGRATGWVLRHFPITTPADRNRKLVLIGVADAANQYGKGARPGLAVLGAEWSFDRSTVIRHLNWLKEHGWLEETHKGNGRGDASIFDLPKMVADCDPSESEEESQTATLPPAKRSQSRARKVAKSVSPTSSSTVENNGKETPELELESTPPPKPIEKRIAERVWERKNPKPATKFIAVVKIARTLLDAGWKPQQIEDAMVSVRTISVAWVEGELNKSHERPGAASRTVDEDRDSPGGRIAL